MYTYIVCNFHCFINILTSSRILSIYSNAFLWSISCKWHYNARCKRRRSLYKIDLTKTNVCKFLHAEGPLSPKFKHCVHVHFRLLFVIAFNAWRDIWCIFSFYGIDSLFRITYYLVSILNEIFNYYTTILVLLYAKILNG